MSWTMLVLRKVARAFPMVKPGVRLREKEIMRLNRWKSIAAVILLAAASCVSVKNYPLARNGTAACVIVLADSAGPVEKHAAAELAMYLEKVTGARVAQDHAPQAGKYSIWLGRPETCAAIAKFGALQDVQALSDQGFVLKADERGLLIAGKKPMGVLYGVYGFLEEHVGVRWFFPGDDGEYCPKTPGLKIGRIDDKQNPSFKERILGLANTATNARMTNTWDWAVRNRMQLTGFRPENHDEFGEARGGVVPLWGGHVMCELVPDSLFDAHPEYFALIDGKRCKQLSPTRLFMTQPCTSNPDVIEMSAQRILKFFREYPNGQFTLINNDCAQPMTRASAQPTCWSDRM